MLVNVFPSSIHVIHLFHSFNDYSTVSEVTLGQPGKSGHLHNQDILVWSQSIRIIQVPLYMKIQNVHKALSV